MKKLALVVGALLTISLSSFAADGDGTIITKVETGNRTDNGSDYNFTSWITEGVFKGTNWEGFQLGYYIEKTHNETDDHDGEMELEIRPGYEKQTSWGSVGGQVTFEQGRYAGATTGWDAIKPEAWATYNINEKSRVFGRAMYSNLQKTGVAEDDGWFEVEAQYRYDIAGGTAMAGVFYAPSIEDWSNDGWEGTEETRLLANYAKWWPSMKVFTVLYGDVRQVKANDGGDWCNAYKVSLYANTPIPYVDGLVLEGEVNRFSHFDTVWDTKNPYAENFFMLGLRYNY